MIFIAYAHRMTDPEKWDPLESLGATGTTVARNIARLRTEKGLAFTELAARLDELDRPIPTLGLRKIESGGRRVDSDDLVALSLALGVAPVTLLMPISSRDEPVESTGVADVPAKQLWQWLIGEMPLRETGRKSLLEFLAAALPPWALDEISVVERGIEPNVTTIVRRQSVVDGNDQ